MKLLQTYEVPKLNEEGLDELLDMLPAPPRRWTKEVPARNVKSMPPNLDINTPVPPPRNNKLKKLNSSSSAPSNVSILIFHIIYITFVVRFDYSVLLNYRFYIHISEVKKTNFVGFSCQKAYLDLNSWLL